MSGKSNTYRGGRDPLFLRTEKSADPIKFYDGMAAQPVNRSFEQAALVARQAKTPEAAPSNDDIPTGPVNPRLWYFNW